MKLMKVLMTATVPSMIGQFNMNNIEVLQRLGYQVHIACNFRDTSVWNKERTRSFLQDVKKRGVIVHQIDFARSPLNVKKDILSYQQLKAVFQENKFRFVHCHTPVAGVISRVVAHMCGVKVIYTAHGFHFYKGAPLKNWLIFYPIEKFFSRWTDVLITITKEDYQRALTRFHARKTVYVPGIGVDLKKFQDVPADRDTVRKSLGVQEDELLILSVGELNENKNHSTVIQAMAKLRKDNVKYCIAGKGILENDLKKQADELHLSENVTLLGYRTDVAELLKAADVYILPSIREGLNVSLMEAMASGLPCICGDIRGNTDLIENRKGGYCVPPLDADAIAGSIRQLENAEKRVKMSRFNQNKITGFDISIVENKMQEIYNGLKCEK